MSRAKKNFGGLFGCGVNVADSDEKAAVAFLGLVAWMKVT